MLALQDTEDVTYLLVGVFFSFSPGLCGNKKANALERAVGAAPASAIGMKRCKKPKNTRRSSNGSVYGSVCFLVRTSNSDGRRPTGRYESIDRDAKVAMARAASVGMRKVSSFRDQMLFENLFLLRALIVDLGVYVPRVMLFTRYQPASDISRAVLVLSCFPLSVNSQKCRYRSVCDKRFFKKGNIINRKMLSLPSL